MKRFLFLWPYYVFDISFNSVKAVSNAELQDISRLNTSFLKVTQVVEMVNILSWYN